MEVPVLPSRHLVQISSVTQNAAQVVTESPSLLSKLLRQPPEIIGKVLHHLDVKDLLSLRSVNHALHAVVHDNEASISGGYCRILARRNPAIHLPTSVHGDVPDFIQYIDLQRRYQSVWELSRILTDHFVSHLHEKDVIDKALTQRLRDTKRPVIRATVFPALFNLNNFFDCLRVVILDAEKAFQEWSDEEVVAAVDVFMLDQQCIIQNLCRTSEDIIDLVAVWSILHTVCAANKIRFSMKAPRYPFPTVRRLLALCGLPVFTQLLNCSPDVALRRNVLSKISAQVLKPGIPDPAAQHHISSIHHLATDRLQLTNYSTTRPYKAVNAFHENQKLVSRPALAVLQRQGERDNRDLDLRTSPGPWIISKLQENDARSSKESQPIVYAFTDYTAQIG